MTNTMSDTNGAPTESETTLAAEAADQAASGIEDAGEPVVAELPENPFAERVTQLEADCAALKDQLLRALAETENVRKRADRRIQEEKVFAIEKFARDVLGVSDNMMRALAALDDSARAGLSEQARTVFDGVDLTRNELMNVLSRHGVRPIDTTPGVNFDPNLHQAVAQIPSEQPAGAVAQEFQSGWLIGERVLRAALVAVSAGPAN